MDVHGKQPKIESNLPIFNQKTDPRGYSAFPYYHEGVKRAASAAAIPHFFIFDI
jgi:hypothetical protein